MAGDWIPIRIDIHEDPAVMAMASDLDVREETVVGHLVRIWGWVSRQCNGDTVTGVTLDALGRVTDSRGYPQLMEKYGWLTAGVTDTGKPFIRIEKFDRWLSKTAKVRAATRLRVGEHRKAQQECNAASVTNVTQMKQKTCANVTPTEHNRREENRREDKKENTPLSPPRGGDVPADPPGKPRRRKRVNRDRTYSPAFESVWADWRPYESPKGDKARAADLFEDMTDEDQQAFAVAAQAYCDERRRLRCKTEHMSTVLNGDWREHLVEKPRQVNPEYSPEFEAFWSDYPHRGIPQEKVESFAQWTQLAEFDWDNMPRAVANYKRSQLVKDGFAKSAFNFLAKRIFADFISLTEDQINAATLDPSERERLERRKDYLREMAEHRRLGEERRQAQAGMPPITPQLRRP